MSKDDTGVKPGKMTIYHKPDSRRMSEASFVQALCSRFPDAEYRKENYPIAAHYLHKFVETESLVAALDGDERLPPKRRILCRTILAGCPPHLHLLRFTPRRAGSVWSITNIRRVEKLIEIGLMTPAGMDKVTEAQQNGQWAIGLAAAQTNLISPALKAAL